MRVTLPNFGDKTINARGFAFEPLSLALTQLVIETQQKRNRANEVRRLLGSCVRWGAPTLVIDAANQPATARLISVRLRVLVLMQRPGIMLLIMSLLSACGSLLRSSP